EDVVAALIEQAYVNVRAASGAILVRLRHERRLHSMPRGDAAYQALEPRRLIAGEQRVGRMPQIDFVLRRSVLREHRPGGHALRFAGRSDVREQRRVFVEVGHGVDLRARLATAQLRRSRRLYAALCGALWIEQVELQLDCDHRRQTQRAESIEYAREHMAWIAEKRCAVVVVHRDLNLRYAFVRAPRRGQERAWNRQAAAVRIALVEAEAGLLDRAAEHIEREHRTGQEKAAAPERGRLMQRHALAPKDAVEVRQQDVDEARLRLRA